MKFDVTGVEQSQGLDQFRSDWIDATIHENSIILGEGEARISSAQLFVINLFCNETRVKMLLPLLKQTKRKKEYRIRINPKLVYENIANLMEHNVLRELSSNEYTLTPIGKQILGEYLTFMQRIKKTLREFER